MHPQPAHARYFVCVIVYFILLLYIIYYIIFNIILYYLKQKSGKPILCTRVLTDTKNVENDDYYLRISTINQTFLLFQIMSQMPCLPVNQPLQLYTQPMCVRVCVRENVLHYKARVKVCLQNIREGSLLLGRHLVTLDLTAWVEV